MVQTLGHGDAEIERRIQKLAQDNKWKGKDAVFNASVHAYTGSDYHRINPHLWLDATVGQAEAERVAAVVNQGMAGMTKHSGQVSRGVRSFDQAYLNKAKEAQATGKPIELHGFQSADTKGGWDKDIVLIIEAKGIQGVDINKISQHVGELEVLFPHKARFFVEIVVPVGGKYHIYVYEDPAAMTGPAIKLAASL